MVLSWKVFLKGKVRLAPKKDTEGSKTNILFCLHGQDNAGHITLDQETGFLKYYKIWHGIKLTLVRIDDLYLYLIRQILSVCPSLLLLSIKFYWAQCADCSWNICNIGKLFKQKQQNAMRQTFPQVKKNPKNNFVDNSCCVLRMVRWLIWLCLWCFLSIRCSIFNVIHAWCLQLAPYK